MTARYLSVVPLNAGEVAPIDLPSEFDPTRDFFPQVRPLTKPPADAPTLCDVVRSFVLMDVQLLVNAAAADEDES